MGPLTGIKIIEMSGLGPGPFAGMILADMGADVIIVERKSDLGKPKIAECNRRGKRSIALDLKDEKDNGTLLKLIDQADVLFEGFRPGVMERNGLGPDVCLDRNEKLVYARMTGWGQTGPLAQSAGHDINYIALTGVLHAIGHSGHRPVPPLNLVGDYGGGGMFLVTGILAAYIEAQKSGKGQVVDVAMTDGSAVLMSMFNTLDSIGLWSVTRGQNWLDSGSHFYDTYETKDGKYVAIGAIEPKFYAQVLNLAQVNPEEYDEQLNSSKWPEYKEKLAAVFRSKTREEWCEIMEGSDACFAPVLDYKEAQQHPHNLARDTYIDLDGIKQPAPAPRFSRTNSEVRSGSPAPGENSTEILESWLS